MAAKKAQPASTLGSQGSLETEEQNLPLEERSIIKHYKTFIKENGGHCRQEWDRAEENQAFAGGGMAQWDPKAWKAREDSGRPAFTINDTELATRAISGRELTARFEPSFIGRGEEDEQRMSVFREIVRYLRHKAGCDNKESHAFMDLSKDNYSVLELRRVYDGPDPKGRTIMEHNPLWEHVWDKRAREVCFTDRSADARGYYVSIDEYLMLYPLERERLKERLAAKANWVSASTRVSYKHPWTAWIEGGQFINREERQIFLACYHWKEKEGAYIATVPAGFAPHPVGPEAWAAIGAAMGGEPLPPASTPELWAQMKPVLEQLAAQGLIAPNLPFLARPRLMKMSEAEWAGFQEAYGQALGQLPDAMSPEDGVFQWVRKEAIICGDDVVKQRVLPFRHFPRIYMTGVPVSLYAGTTMHSVVDSMKAPQQFKNQMISWLSSHVQRSQKMGLAYHANAFEDPQDLANKLSQPFWLMQIKNGVPFDEAFREVEGAGFPAGLDRFLEIADQATWRGTGMNPNTLGNLQDPRRVSGTVFSALADAVMTVLSWEFNSLQSAKKISAELMLDHTREYLSADDVIDIVGSKKAPFVPEQAEWSYSFDVDAITVEVPTTKNEKEQAWEAIGPTASLEKWITGGIAPAWLLPEMMPESWLPAEKRKAWLDWLDAKGIGPNAPVQPPPAPGQEQAGGQPPPQEGMVQ